MALGQSKYFSTLDMASHYWQVPVRGQDSGKTAFITPLGPFEFDCPLQRLMERCLGGFNSDTVFVCLKNIIISLKPARVMSNRWTGCW